MAKIKLRTSMEYFDEGAGSLWFYDEEGNYIYTERCNYWMNAGYGNFRFPDPTHALRGELLDAQINSIKIHGTAKCLLIGSGGHGESNIGLVILDWEDFPHDYEGSEAYYNNPDESDSFTITKTINPLTGEAFTVDEVISRVRFRFHLEAYTYEDCTRVISDIDDMYLEVDYVPRDIIVVTKIATNIGNLKSTLNAEITDWGGEVLTRGFEYWEDGYPDNKVVIGEDNGFGNGNYNLVAGVSPEEPLKANTKYIFKAFASNEVGTAYGDELSFTTTNIKPTITTQIATDIEVTSVMGNGTIEDGGGLETCLERGFEIDYEFSGNLEEYNAWVGHGFIGDIVYNPTNDKWEGTITKSCTELGSYSEGTFNLILDNLVNNKIYKYRAKGRNSVGWGYGAYLEFTTDVFLTRKSCTCGIFTILLCAYTGSIPEGSIIKRRGFRWGTLISAQEYDIHEDGNFPASAIIGPITISFVKSNDDDVYDTIIDSSGGFLSAGFIAGEFIDISSTEPIEPKNKGQFKIISVTPDTITINVRNTLVSETVSDVTIVELFALYIVDLDPETDYYSVAYVAIEDSGGNWTVQEGNVTLTTTIVNIFDFEGYDKVEFYKPEREQNYRKITRKIEAEIIAEQQYIDKAGGRRVLDIPNHLIQTKENAVFIGTNYKDRFKNIKSKMEIEYPTPAPFQREDTLDIGFGRIRFKEDGKGVVNFMPDGEGLMLFRYRMIMIIRKINMGYMVAKESIDYMATMELEEA